MAVRLGSLDEAVEVGEGGGPGGGEANSICKCNTELLAEGLQGGSVPPIAQSVPTPGAGRSN